MMKGTPLFLLVIGCVIVFSPLAQAGLVNAGFEAGLNGWSVSGSSASAVTGHSGDLGVSYIPQEGSWFLSILADEYNTSVSQTVALLSGETLSGSAAFDWRDYPYFYDAASVNILDVTGAVIATPWSESGTGHPSYWDGPWTQWSWTAPSEGTYTLVYAAGNTSDTAGDPYALFDAAQTSGPIVPEPSTLVLLGSALLGMTGFFRKNRVK